MSSQSVHIRLGPALLAELDRRRRALPVPASRNAYATYLLHGALGGETAPAAAPPMAGPEALEQDRVRARDGARLRAARKTAGLSQAATGEAAGVSEDVVRRCEKGERDLARYPALLAWVECQRVGSDTTD